MMPIVRADRLSSRLGGTPVTQCGPAPAAQARLVDDREIQGLGSRTQIGEALGSDSSDDQRSALPRALAQPGKKFEDSSGQDVRHDEIEGCFRRLPERLGRAVERSSIAVEVKVARREVDNLPRDVV